MRHDSLLSRPAWLSAVFPSVTVDVVGLLSLFTQHTSSWGRVAISLERMLLTPR